MSVSIDTVRSFETPAPGELLVVPPRSSWRGVLETNLEGARTWDFTVAGVPVGELRAMARSEAVSEAIGFTSRIEGVDTRAVGSTAHRPVVMTGHQPELFHPGIWVKDFLLDELAEETSSVGVDLVVDSDGFEALEVTAPCMEPVVHKCSAALAVAAKDACFACTAVPTKAAIDDFCGEVESMLQTLSSHEPAANFEVFCGALRESSRVADNVAELVTLARRSYESRAGTKYLELPVTAFGRSTAFSTFVFDLAANAERFAGIYNSELDAFREATSTRSKVQPFPNLDHLHDRCELPFWVLGNGRRATLWVSCAADGRSVLWADGEEIGRFEAADAERFVEAASGWGLAPKALTLTLFARVVLCDLFIHGTGGARYDRVTDGVIRRYWGIEPPSFVVASLTERLALGVDVVSDEDVSRALERLNRFRHNPDAMLTQARFADDAQEARARELVAEKADAVQAIAQPEADKKALGLRIREINEELRKAMAPLGEQLRAEAEGLAAARRDAEVLEDRTYPFCFWDPRRIAERARQAGS